MRTRDLLTVGAPLALSLVALAVREATRAPRFAAQRQRTAREFVPPQAFLAAAALSLDGLTLQIDGASSHAFTVHGDERAQYAPRGTLRVGSNSSAAEIDLAWGDGEAAATSLRARGETVRVIPATGARTATLNAEVRAGASELTGPLDAAWLRLPDGRVRLHGVMALGVSNGGGTWWDREAPRDQLVLDLTLLPEHEQR